MAPWNLTGQSYGFQPENRLCCTCLGRSKSQRKSNYIIGSKVTARGEFCLLELHGEGFVPRACATGLFINIKYT